MQKIFFNDKFGLTKAVLEGRKTMTRRIAYMGDIQKPKAGFLTEGSVAGTLVLTDNWKAVAKSRYKVGEVVAVAQSYKSIGRFTFSGDINPGYSNKMFVQADLMPHQIRITNIKVERLQDISDEDCMKEGIFWDYGDYPYMATKMYKYNDKDEYIHPKSAFAALINKISGKGTWASNPWVFVYEFELVK